MNRGVGRQRQRHRATGAREPEARHGQTIDHGRETDADTIGAERVDSN